MINKLTFKNFKSFKGQTTINIRPLTVLIGTNSSGKSNILRLLRLLKSSYIFGTFGELLKSTPGDVEFSDVTDLTFLNNEEPIEIEVSGDLARDQGDGIATMNAGEATIRIKVSRKSQEYSFTSWQSDFGFTTEAWEQVVRTLTQMGEPETPPAEIEPKEKGKADLARTRHDLSTVKDAEYFVVEMKDRCMAAFENEMINIAPNWKEYIVELLSKAFSKELTVQDLEKLISTWAKMYWILDLEAQGLRMEVSPFDRGLGRAYPSYQTNNIEKVLPAEDTKKIRGASLTRLVDKSAALKNGFLHAEGFLADHSLAKARPEIGFLLLDNIMDILCDAAEAPRDEATSLIRNDVKWTSDRLFDRITATGPLRNRPKRFYTKEELLTDFLQMPPNYAFTDERLDEIAGLVSQQLPYLGVESDLLIQRSEGKNGTPAIYSIVLRDKITKACHNVADVGFGISQIVPVIMTLDLSIDRELVIIEQPEIHLHPRSQARFSNILVGGPFKESEDDQQKGAKSMVRRIQSTNRIVETHSEHLVRGIQILVAKGEIKSEEVAIYFVSKDRDGVSTAKLMPLDERGFFVEKWPEGFFDQTYLQSVELMSARN